VRKINCNNHITHLCQVGLLTSELQLQKDLPQYIQRFIETKSKIHEDFVSYLRDTYHGITPTYIRPKLNEFTGIAQLENKYDERLKREKLSLKVSLCPKHADKCSLALCPKHADKCSPSLYETISPSPFMQILNNEEIVPVLITKEKIIRSLYTLLGIFKNKRCIMKNKLISSTSYIRQQNIDLDLIIKFSQIFSTEVKYENVYVICVQNDINLYDDAELIFNEINK
jgi:hypothetical protein